jgi:hypothetical protein
MVRADAKAETSRVPALHQAGKKRRRGKDLHLPQCRNFRQASKPRRACHFKFRVASVLTFLAA